MWQVMVDWCCMAPHKVTTDPLPGSLNLRLVKAKEEFQLNYFYKFCTETSSSVSSVAFCPYDEPFMLLGSEDGSIRLHSTNNDRWKKIFYLQFEKPCSQRPLITWAGTVDNEPIVKVVWSTSRPCVFFILDTANR